jgi:D-alanyl-D-alanine carboxypeptidase/D-alanyl-D-alanine carboxypeptidase (penicillin-binding protein 5/6)
MRVRYVLCIILSVLIALFCSPFAFAQGVPEVSARSAVLINADTLEVVFEKNPRERLPMASTTKIMTSLIALEQGENDKQVTLTDAMVNVEGTSMGLKAGDSASLYTLVCGMLLASGNDAANAVAISLGGSVTGFCDEMNRRAQELDMTDTHFVTPSGLDAEGHYSTALDMAKLGAAAIKNTTFRQICSSESLAVYYGNPPYRRILTNHNSLLKRVDGVIGIKTGFTKKSGRCLVSAAERDGVTLVAVTLNDPNDWRDHGRLLEYGFERVERYELDTDFTEVSLRVTGGNAAYIDVEASSKPYFTGFDGDNIKREVFVAPFLYAPVFEGQKVGEAYYYKDGRIIARVDIISTRRVEIREHKQGAVKKSFFEKIKDLFRR